MCVITLCTRGALDRATRRRSTAAFDVRPSVSAVRERYDSFWARYLGVSANQLNEPGVSVAAHVGLSGYNGVWFFRRNQSTIVSAPADWVQTLRRRIPSIPEEFASTSFFEEIFGEHFERIVGPAFQGYLIGGSVDGEKASQTAANFIGANDSALVDSFRSQCGQESWEESGLGEATQYLAAVRVGNAIVSLAGYRAWTREAGDVCVLTHPARHRRGFATAAARTVVEHALKDGKLMLYQTLESNTAAIKIAQHLGYAQYASHVAVRLRAKPQ